jgi:hypothetical protein
MKNYEKTFNKPVHNQDEPLIKPIDIELEQAEHIKLSGLKEN